MNRICTWYDADAARITENGRTITLLSLGVPILLENLFLQLYGTANTMLLSGLSQEAVSAVSVSEQLVSIALCLLNMVIRGAVILSSVALGAGETAQAASAAGTASALTLGGAVGFGGLLAALAVPLTGAMHLSGAVQTMAVGYLRIRAAALPAAALMSLLNNLLICAGRAKATMLVGMGSNLLNVALVYAVLYGGVSLPVGGTSAAALAGAAAQLAGLGLAAGLFRRFRCPFRAHCTAHTARQMLRLGIPGGMCLFSYTLAQTVTTGFVAALGTAAVNTKVYITNITAYTSKLSYAIGSGTAILIGRHKGAGRTAQIRALFRQNLLLAVGCNLLLALAAYAARAPLLGLFTDDQAIMAAAGAILGIDVAVECARAVNHVAENALNANGDVRATLASSVASGWLCSVLLSFVLCNRLGMGLAGIWIAFFADEAIKGGLYLLRWRSGKWAQARVS